MKIIQPVAINDATLTSSSVAEDDYAAWTSGTTYAATANVIRGHRRWRSLQASNLGHDPGLDDQDAPVWWVDMGPTNRYAMFDESVGTDTTAGDAITVVIAPGTTVDAIGLLDIQAETIEVSMTVDGDEVYNSVQSTYGTGQAITNLYLYFTARIGRRSVVLFMDMPRRVGCIVTLTATARPGEDVSIGTMGIGTSLEIGSTEVGAKVGITDYSLKKTDDFGNTKFVRRNYAKRNNVRVILPAENVDTVFNALAELRTIPIIWVASTRFDCLVTFGAWKTFEIDVAYYNMAYCSLETENLV
ncbi:hypothetical protein HY78_00930 [Rhizorhabdus wittichii DC-6]|nr:hypothetical protein HY78_00930 [Rhizorhabdus wittichii DC-6]